MTAMTSWRTELRLKGQAIWRVLRGRGVMYRVVMSNSGGPDSVWLGHYRGSSLMTTQCTFNGYPPKSGQYSHTMAEVDADMLRRRGTVVDGKGNAYDTESLRW